MRHVLENWSGSRDSTWWRNWSTGIPAGNHPCRSPDLVLVGELELGFGETPANSESAFSPILYGNENGGSGSRNIQQTATPTEWKRTRLASTQREIPALGLNEKSC
jgi:hypothetical protein